MTDEHPPQTGNMDEHLRPLTPSSTCAVYGLGGEHPVFALDRGGKVVELPDHIIKWLADSRDNLGHIVGDD